VKKVGVFIKNLVINEISGGVVNFGNSTNGGSIQTSKSVRDTAAEEAQNENDSSQDVASKKRAYFLNLGF
jgi:hypothetical protein